MSAPAFEAVRADEGLAPTYAAIQVASWQAAYEGIVPADFLRGLSVSEREAAFRRRLARPEVESFVFRVDGTPAGLAAVLPYPEGDASDGEVSALYFLPAYWGRGFGALAMGVCLDALCAGGFARAVLWVLQDNWRARRFYEKQGFVPTGHTQTVTLGEPLEECEYARML